MGTERRCKKKTPRQTIVLFEKVEILSGQLSSYRIMRRIVYNRHGAEAENADRRLGSVDNASYSKLDVSALAVHPE